MTSPPGIPASVTFAAPGCSGPSNSSPIAKPESRWHLTDPAARDDAVTGACKESGLLPFVNFNRVHVVPPCTVTDGEAREGLALLDAALEIADRHTVA